MSYYATGFGSMTAKNGAPKDEIEKTLGEVGFDICFDDNNYSDVEFNGNYRYDEVNAAFDKVNPYLEDYEIDFDGEGDCWQLNKKAGDDPGVKLYKSIAHENLVKGGYSEEETERIMQIIGF